MILGSYEQLQQQLEYTLLKPDCHSWWISKMQSRREDTLEERYAIKFWFKLGKNDATETYGMLQAAFRPCCMNRASGREKERYAIKFCFKLGKHAMKARSAVMTQRRRDKVPSRSMLALPDWRRPDRINPPTNFWWSLFWQYWHDIHALGSQWTDSQQGILCWGFKGVQEEIPSEEASTLQIGSVAFPPGHNSILVTDYLTKIGIKTLPPPPYSPEFAPCDFCLFPKLRGCRYGTIEEMKGTVTKVIDMLTQEDFHGASRSCWNGTTSGLQPEKITSKVTKVSYVYYE